MTAQIHQSSGRAGWAREGRLPAAEHEQQVSEIDATGPFEWC